ncbi:MAG: hypothetical protein WBQ60_11085 [Asticcacaulis sp.]
MNWLWGILIAGVSGAGGFMFAAKLAFSNAAEEKWQIIREQAIDRRNYLGAVRRGIANVLMERSPDLYKTCFSQICKRVDDIANKSDELVKAEFAHIAKKYPIYENFDPFQSYDYVLLADAASMESDDELLERYSDIIYFEGLSAKIFKSWWLFKPVPESQREYLSDYVQKYKDTLFLARLKEAETIFQLTRGESVFVDNIIFSIRSVPHIAEVSYGVTFKDTGECGVFSTFYGDDKNFKGYYRADTSFEDWKVLRV